MKKPYTLLLALVVCAALLLAVLPGPTAAAKVSFVSINDLLPPELINCTTSYGGNVYVPYSVFSSYGLGVGYSYFSDASTAYFYSGNTDLFFDMVNGKCFDGDEYQYSATAIFYGGTVYVPLYFTAGFFGIGVSSISGNDSGSILRLTNGAQVLDDDEFLNAAKRIMQEYAQAFETPEVTEAPETPEPTDSPEPTPTPTPTPTRTPAPGENDHSEDTLRLSFLGLPDTEVLDLMDQMGMRACVFLRAADIRARADDVRRLVCSGWSIGICCDSDGLEEREQADALLYDAARLRTVLVSAPSENAEACRAAAERLELVFVDTDIDASDIRAGASGAYPFTQQLQQGGDHSVRLNSSAENLKSLNMLLQYIRDGKFALELQRETAA